MPVSPGDISQKGDRVDHFRRFPEVKTLRHTLSHAGGLQTLVHPIHAVVAFDDFAFFRIPLRGAPGAGFHAGFASYAEVMIHENDAVFCPFLHGFGRTGGHAPGPVAMVAGHKDEIYFGNTSHPFGADRLNPAQPGACGQSFIKKVPFLIGTNLSLHARCD
jgi:hypothetical protein